MSTRCTLQRMARARSEQAADWPLVSDWSVRRGSWSSVTSRVRHQAFFTRAGCPAVTVTLEAGGADTYTQRAIPGPEPSTRTLAPSGLMPTPPHAEGTPWTLTRKVSIRGHGYLRGRVEASQACCLREATLARTADCQYRC